MRVWCSVRDLRRWLAKRARDAGLWLADGATRPDEPGPWFIYAERHRRGLLLAIMAYAHPAGGCEVELGAPMVDGFARPALEAADLGAIAAAWLAEVKSELAGGSLPKARGGRPRKTSLTEYERETAEAYERVLESGVPKEVAAMQFGHTDTDQTHTVKTLDRWLALLREIRSKTQ